MSSGNLEAVAIASDHAGFELKTEMKAYLEQIGVQVLDLGPETAERFRNVRGALVHNGLAARLARQHNDANVLCLGSRLVGVEVAKDAISAFLNTPFEGGRHAGRVKKIDSVVTAQ